MAVSNIANFIRNEMVYSDKQETIFDFATNGVGNAVVIAVAGSGKTTTLAETFRRVVGSAIFLAFGKANAEDLKGRGVNARTFHSMVYSVVLRHKKQRDVTRDKKRELFSSAVSGDLFRLYASFSFKLVGLALQSGVGILVEDTEQTWVDIAEHHDIELDHELASFAKGIELARMLFQLNNASNLVDFDDMMYIAVADGLVLPKYDWVFVDEAQDTNAIQREIIRKIMKSSSRLIAVGDPSQAIFGFRGSDSQSIELIKSEFNAIELPLTVSYRCPKAVVEHARQWVSHIEAAPDAEEGSVTDLGRKWDMSAFKANDLVVCRFTRPIISLAYKLMRERVPAYVMGKEIGEGLVNLIKKMDARGISGLYDKLVEYTAREVEKAITKKQESKAEAIQDKSDCLYFLIDELGENECSIPGLIRVIDSLFSFKNESVKLSTVHRAKGLEATRVFWLNPGASARARQKWQQEQEDNLCYVAATRAKHELVLIQETKRGSR